MTEYVDCRECNTECARADGNYGYTFCSCFTPKKKPMTNADRIRAMSDEELCKLIKPIPDFPCDLIGYPDKCMDSCEVCILKWLQQPAEEDGHD